MTARTTGLPLSIVTTNSTGSLLWKQLADGASPDELAELNVSVAGFWIRPLTETPERLAAPLAELFEYVRDGSLRPHIGRVYALDEVREAHADLEGRRSVGKLLLAP